MEKITTKEFLLRQPSFPEPTETDTYYVGLANKLLDVCSHSELSRQLADGITRRIALTLTDYMQDIVADGGLWRSFVDANRELYGWSVPFHPVPEEYVDYELNREDVRFLVWYVIAMLDEERRDIYPHQQDVLDMADACFCLLDNEYDDAPVNESFNLARGLEFNDPEDHKAIYQLGNWLFLHSYLLTPAYAHSLREVMSDIDVSSPDAMKELNDRLEQAMMEDTTGPLALFTPEWVYLMIERKLPKDIKKKENAGAAHPYWEKFTTYTGGEEIRFFDSYEAMNRFFVDALGWEDGIEHLSQAKGAHDYILLVTHDKGMLMARDIARCVKSPANPLYDASYARKHAFELLSERGVCPGDLLRYIFEHDWLPDAVFPGTEDYSLVADNRDFIARCYLQIYYRGD